MLNEVTSDYIELFSSGSNSHGQLGTGHTEDLQEFTSIERWSTSTEILSFAAGARHSIFLIRNQLDGFPKILGSGDRTNFQLPINSDRTTETRLTEIDYQNLILSIQSIDPELREKLLSSYQPTIVGSSWETSFVNLDPIKDRCSENDSSVLVSFGSNDFGLRGTQNGSVTRLEDPSIVEFNIPPRSAFRISNLVGGPKHVIAVVSIRSFDSNTTSVEIIGWGAARHGQLGSSETREKPFKTLPPTRINLSFELPRDTDSIKIGVGKEHTVIACPGHIYSLGNHKYSQNQIPEFESEDHILDVQCCWNTTFFLKQPAIGNEPPSSCLLLGFGNNSQAQLGSLDPNILLSETQLNGSPSSIKLAVGSEHAMVSARSDLIYGWGWNEHAT
ncbi:uncharacterized protein MELLADRAFT_87645 [Melampsora larici-populina 98AG31]|uniref:Uncharacterized protein n=1 Tax=Melampsora larici-populina (strain 98AG31 / pathotype 3-4-7) TaxID=747676 RepID=F4RP65_MELLP|nr:uncharacterized protein MELLADRAFT_87645 [Melampsora larici-populina 98AG31]EGG05903.1 hypothetical protein MELLADRAFT_87645 [Melampsora larici-populina 98AG31]